MGERARQQQGRRTDLFQIVEKSPPPIHAAEQAARLVGTNRQYVSDAKKIATEARAQGAPDRLLILQICRINHTRARRGRLTCKFASLARSAPHPRAQGAPEAVGIPRRTVSDKIADFGETNQMSDSAIFRDFEPQITTPARAGGASPRLLLAV